MTTTATTPAWIGLGSNLGDRAATLDAAVAALEKVPGVVVRRVSRHHETQPVGGPSGQGAFLNAAARLDTTLTPHHLLAATQTIEDQAKRVRTVRWGERTLDVDLLIYGTKFLDTPELKLPHPRLALRRFVLAPLAEIAPDIVETVSKRTIADLLANLDRLPRLITLRGPDTALKARVFRGLVEALPGIAIERTEIPREFELSTENLWNYWDLVARQLEALDTRRRPNDPDIELWRVSDFRVDPGWVRTVTSDSMRSFVEFGHLDELAEQRRKEEELRGRVERARIHALIPTFEVIMPDSAMTRKPGVSNIPTLWPESDDPDAIVLEVLATCRGIDGL